jgi:hypothetical protein
MRYEDNDPLRVVRHDVADGGETWASATVAGPIPICHPPAKSTATFGYPFAYIRNDRVSSIIYRGSDDHELALPAERWSCGSQELKFEFGVGWHLLSVFNAYTPPSDDGGSFGCSRSSRRVRILGRPCHILLPRRSAYKRPNYAAYYRRSRPCHQETIYRSRPSLIRADTGAGDILQSSVGKLSDRRSR